MLNVMQCHHHQIQVLAGNENDGDSEDDVNKRSIEALLSNVIKTIRDAGLMHGFKNSSTGWWQV